MRTKRQSQRTRKSRTQIQNQRKHLPRSNQSPQKQPWWSKRSLRQINGQHQTKSFLRKLLQRTSSDQQKSLLSPFQKRTQSKGTRRKTSFLQRIQKFHPKSQKSKMPSLFTRLLFPGFQTPRQRLSSRIVKQSPSSKGKSNEQIFCFDWSKKPTAKFAWSVCENRWLWNQHQFSNQYFHGVHHQSVFSAKTVGG